MNVHKVIRLVQWPLQQIKRPPNKSIKDIFVIIALIWVIRMDLGAQDGPPSKLPNIVIIVADDMGYSDLGCFGSEIATPNIDALAASGQIFNNFHTTASCSPTRAMLLTGVDHHLAGLGSMSEFLNRTSNQTDQPGYEGHLNDHVISMATLLKTQGYRTYIAGKWHLGTTPQQSPTAKGFDRSYVLMQGTARNYYPDTTKRTFWANDQFVSYPMGRFSTAWYTDQLISFLKADEAESRPFFLYAAYTAPHWPLQAPKAFIEKYRGKYDQGYEKLRAQRLTGLIREGIVSKATKLTPLPEQQAAFLDDATPFRKWEALDKMEKKLSARSMEVYAAMLDNLDFHIGRIIDYLKNKGVFDNTLFIFFSDNGADAKERNFSPPNFDQYENMGAPHSYVAYGAGWAHAASVHNRLYKAYSTQGGIHTPLIVKLPYQRDGKGVLTAFTSVLDIMPTVLELARINYPKKYEHDKLFPLQGRSMLPYLKGQKTSVHRKNHSMGWELFGRIGFRKNDWKIIKIPPPMGKDTFALFHLPSDPNEANDLAKTYPKRLTRMVKLWHKYKRENGVILPIWKIK